MIAKLCRKELSIRLRQRPRMHSEIPAGLDNIFPDLGENYPSGPRKIVVSLKYIASDYIKNFAGCTDELCHARRLLVKLREWADMYHAPICADVRRETKLPTNDILKSH